MYLNIFASARQTATQAGRQQAAKEELRMAIRMSALVFTDFCTWVPLVTVSILVQVNVIVIDPVVYAWTVVFVIPINSAINPFLYTLVTFIQDREG